MWRWIADPSFPFMESDTDWTAGFPPPWFLRNVGVWIVNWIFEFEYKKEGWYLKKYQPSLYGLTLFISQSLFPSSSRNLQYSRSPPHRNLIDDLLYSILNAKITLINQTVCVGDGRRTLSDVLRCCERTTAFTPWYATGFPDMITYGGTSLDIRHPLCTSVQLPIWQYWCKVTLPLRMRSHPAYTLLQW